MEVPTDSGGTGGNTGTGAAANGADVFGWILAVGLFVSLIGLIVYHKRSVGDWGGSGSGSGGNPNAYGEL